MKFVKYKDYWWRLESNYPYKKVYNEYSGFMYLEKDWTEYEHAETDDVSQLDWRDTKVINNYSKTGWLDRQGNFYACDVACHDEQAEYIHKKCQRELELEGWIRIVEQTTYLIDEENSGKTTTLKRYYALFSAEENSIMPTNEQIQKLESMPYVNLQYINEAMKRRERDDSVSFKL